MKIFRYLRTLKNYFRTPKARHDFWDYLFTLVIIFLTSLVVAFVLGTVVLNVTN